MTEEKDADENGEELARGGDDAACKRTQAGDRGVDKVL